MGIFKGEPRLVTPGQKTVKEGNAGVEWQGAFVGLDWLGVSFKTPEGSVQDHERFDADIGADGVVKTHEEYPPWRQAIAPEDRDPDTIPIIARHQDRMYSALLLNREHELRDRVKVAVCLALKCGVDDWYERDGGADGYNKSIVGPEGVRIDYDRTGNAVAGTGYYFHLTLPGKACRMMSEASARKLIRFAVDNFGTATRIDLAMDDYQRVMPIDEIDRVTMTPDFVSRTHRVLTMRSHAPGSSEVTGQTLYVGGSKSRRILRIYDKWLEGGELDCIRWEMEEKKSAAAELMVQLTERDPITNKPKPWAEIAAARLVSFVDFRDSGSRYNVDQRTRLEWFALLVSQIKRARVYPPSLPGTVDQMKQWVEKQIGPSLWVIVKAAAGSLEDIYGMIDRAEPRIRPRHKALLANFQPS